MAAKRRSKKSQQLCRPNAGYGSNENWSEVSHKYVLSGLEATRLHMRCDDSYLIYWSHETWPELQWQLHTRIYFSHETWTVQTTVYCRLQKPPEIPSVATATMSCTLRQPHDLMKVVMKSRCRKLWEARDLTCVVKETMDYDTSTTRHPL